MPLPLAQWTVVFDLDGTLIDTAPDLLAAMNHALTETGYDPVDDAVGRSCIGNGAKAMLRAGLAAQNACVTDTQLDKMWRVFIDYYVAHIVDHSRPFSDCEAVLQTLSDLGARLAVCTNKTQHLAELVLGELGLAHRFSAIKGADAVPSKKPDGDHILRTIDTAGGIASSAIMIGDSATDEAAASDAELPLIYVEFGYGPEPQALNDQAIRVSNYSDVLKAVRTIAGVNAAT